MFGEQMSTCWIAILSSEIGFQIGLLA